MYIYNEVLHLAVTMHFKQVCHYHSARPWHILFALAQQTSQNCPLGYVIIESQSVGTMTTCAVFCIAFSLFSDVGFA